MLLTWEGVDMNRMPTAWNGPHQHKNIAKVVGASSALPAFMMSGSTPGMVPVPKMYKCERSD